MLVCSLFLSGCGTINIYHKLYRDGTSDLSVEVKSDSQFFLNMIKDGFENDPLMERATIIEEDGGFKYVLEKAKLDNIANGSKNKENVFR
jgi:hypothetical protein